MDRLRAMETFTRVVRAGSFSAAAQQLRVSRTIVSKHVSQLENLLGVRLLNRTTRRVSLTESGMAYFEFCSRIINDVEEAELSVTKLHKEPRGALKVLAPKSFGLLHVAPAVCVFSKRYPDIKVSIVLSDNFVDLMDNGFDLAVKVGELEDSSLVARRLGTTRLVPCATPAYLAARGVPKTPLDLAQHNCLSHINQVRDQTWHFGGADGPLAVKINGGPSANSVLFLRDMALADLGIALLPEINIHEDIQNGRLVPLLKEYGTAEFPFHVVYPHNRHLATKVRTFVDCLVEHFKDVVWDDAATPLPAYMKPAERPRTTVRA
jgi:DNA-binding transcriptional LysR family regulator